jgi:CheY-like chemotaxis protein
VTAAAPRRALVVHVVDDHDLSRKHLRTVLAFHGYTVVLSDGAAAARVALLATAPDVVLLDLQMPGESGYELLAWMRTQPVLAGVPVICVTASVPNSERERVQAAGFALFLPKPITPPQRLIDAVQQVLADSAGGPGAAAAR